MCFVYNTLYPFENAKNYLKQLKQDLTYHKT